MYGYCTLGFDELIFFWIRFEHAGSALSAYVDLIQGFLELVRDPPGNKNSESYGLRRPGLDLAGAS